MYARHHRGEHRHLHRPEKQGHTGGRHRYLGTGLPLTDYHLSVGGGHHTVLPLSLGEPCLRRHPGVRLRIDPQRHRQALSEIRRRHPHRCYLFPGVWSEQRPGLQPGVVRAGGGGGRHRTEECGGEEGMIYLRLFYEFFKTGLFAVGGGMATIPFLYNMADATGWFTRMDVDNMIAVGESTPGPIGVNMATYVGYLTGMREGGLPFALLGAVVATLGLITPSIIVILIIASFLKSFRNNRYVESTFYGLRPASTGLIAAAGLSVAMSNLFYVEGEVITKWSDIFDPALVNWKAWALAIVLWVLTNKVKQTKKLHPIIFILAAAVVGVLWGM